MLEHRKSNKLLYLNLNLRNVIVRSRYCSVHLHCSISAHFSMFSKPRETLQSVLRILSTNRGGDSSNKWLLVSFASLLLNEIQGLSSRASTAKQMLIKNTFNSYWYGIVCSFNHLILLGQQRETQVILRWGSDFAGARAAGCWPFSVYTLTGFDYGTSLMYSIIVLIHYHIWTSSWDYGTYRIGDQRRLRRDCASAQSPEPSLFAHIKHGSRQRVWPKIRRVALVDGSACVFEDWAYRGR